VDFLFPRIKLLAALATSSVGLKPKIKLRVVIHDLIVIAEVSSTLNSCK